MPKRAVFLLDMSGARSLLLLLAAMATLAQAFPAAQEEDGDSTGPLPLIQFTKGGIRVNFGGYHAQAGLGGLLTGRKADGGLHASAGTPSGAHASAGLGGSLDGGPAGGIHARAGLGNGGPEAEAGLAGSLAGPQPKGEIYAGSSAGNFDVLDKINSIERQKTRGKNIQIISRPQKANELDAAASSAAVANADANSKTKKRRQTGQRLRRKELRRGNRHGNTEFSPDPQIPAATAEAAANSRKERSLMTSSTSQFRR